MVEMSKWLDHLIERQKRFDGIQLIVTVCVHIKYGVDAHLHTHTKFPSVLHSKSKIYLLHNYTLICI